MNTLSRNVLQSPSKVLYVQGAEKPKKHTCIVSGWVAPSPHPEVVTNEKKSLWHMRTKPNFSKCQEKGMLCWLQKVCMVFSISTSTVINLHLKIINPMSIRTDFVIVIQMQITIQYNYNTNLKCKMLVSMEPPKP